MTTIANYWIDEEKTGVWRTSRRDQHCCHKGCSGIRKGERYLDTGERTADGIWATYKVCEKHAATTVSWEQDR